MSQRVIRYYLNKLWNWKVLESAYNPIHKTETKKTHGSMSKKNKGAFCLSIMQSV